MRLIYRGKWWIIWRIEFLGVVKMFECMEFLCNQFSASHVYTFALFTYLFICLFVYFG